MVEVNYKIVILLITYKRSFDAARSSEHFEILTKSVIK